MYTWVNVLDKVRPTVARTRPLTPRKPIYTTVVLHAPEPYLDDPRHREQGQAGPRNGYERRLFSLALDLHAAPCMLSPRRL